MLLKGFSIATIDLHEVGDDLIVVEFALTGEQAGEADVFDMVAPFAECYETLQALDVPLVVVAPDFVAFELASRATDAAAMVVVGIDLFAQFVPLRSRKHLAHIAVPARFRHKFDGQAKIAS